MGVVETLHTIADIGYIRDFPFKDWEGSEIAGVEICMRLLNAGEIMDINEETEGLALDSLFRVNKVKFLILADALVSWGGNPLAEQEDVDRFNERNASNLTLRAYKIEHLHNLEKIVVDYLDRMYGALQDKQKRVLEGNVMCQVAGHVYPREVAESEEETEWLDHRIAEVISLEGKSLLESQDKMEESSDESDT